MILVESFININHDHLRWIVNTYDGLKRSMMNSSSFNEKQWKRWHNSLQMTLSVAYWNFSFHDISDYMFEFCTDVVQAK